VLTVTANQFLLKANISESQPTKNVSCFQVFRVNFESCPLSGYRPICLINLFSLKVIFLFQLLDDFEQIHPEKAHTLHSAIVLKKDHIVRVAKDRLATSRDKQIKIEINELLDTVSGNVTTRAITCTMEFEA
jgi:hypothetical protein